MTPRSDLVPIGNSPSVPTASDILASVAEDFSLTVDQVERTLAEANITLRSPAPADRRLSVLRLRASGVKHTGEDFAVDQAFGPGLWAIAHPSNSAGKTSLLEFLVTPLRGAHRDLPRDVRSWLRRLRLDVLVAGRPIRIVLDFTPAPAKGENSAPAAPAAPPVPRALAFAQDTIWATERVDVSVSTATDPVQSVPQEPVTYRAPHVDGSILSAGTATALLEAEDESGLRLLDGASGAAEVERVIGAFLLDALRMEHTKLWQGTGGADGEGAPQVHGWTSYFGACYLNPGGDEILLGDVNAVGLSARLLELFVDIPYSTVLTQLNTALKADQKVTTQSVRRADADAAARAGVRTQWEQDLSRVREEMTALRDAQPRDVTHLLRQADSAAAELRDRRRAFAEVDQALAEVAARRLVAQQALLDARETWQSRRVLGRLNPTCCPRCEGPVTPERRAAEKETAACAVCARVLPEVDADLAEAVLRQLADDVTQTLATEQQTTTRHRAAEEDVTRSESAHDRITADVDEALNTSQRHLRLRELELIAAGLEGRLSATEPSDQTRTAPAPLATRILGAVETRVREAVTTSATHLFPSMNTRIVELATAFGVQNLDSVKLDRSGKVNAVKAGVKTPFKSLSRGDRLRMRIATVVAMLRVGASRGVASHPGLLLIDSVAAEEVTAVPARALIAELHRITEELPDLQVILTTAQPDLVEGILPQDHIITSTDEHLF